MMTAMNVATIVSATEGFTGADLKRLVEDGKAICAYDKSRRNELKEPVAYFLGCRGGRTRKQAALCGG